MDGGIGKTENATSPDISATCLFEQKILTFRVITVELYGLGFWREWKRLCECWRDCI